MGFDFDILPKRSGYETYAEYLKAVDEYMDEAYRFTGIPNPKKKQIQENLDSNEEK